MDLLDKINSLTDDQLRMVAEREDVTGVLAAYRLAEMRGLPAPERTVAVMGDGYAIVAANGVIQRIETEGVTKIIRQEGDEYCVYSEDGSRGFGCYPSRAQAEERLRQIHYFSNAEGRFARLPDERVGRIWHVMYDGEAEVPAGPTIQASPDDPAALVVIYTETDEGWVETPMVSGARLADLEMIEPLDKAKVSVGDHVLYAVPKPPGPTTYAHGVVDRVERDGMVSLPGVDESIEATSDDPVAVITVWAETESGYQETDRRVVKPFSQLRVSQEPLEKASKKVMETLREKAEEHNEKVGDAKGKRTTARTLGAVFDRGIGAYRTNPSSVRPSVSSAEQWAYGRVNGFLYALRNGRFKRGAFDQDLLPKEHPLSTKKDVGKESYKPPKGAQEAAQRALEWIKEGHAGSGFTDVGRARAAQLARGDNVSRETVGRMASFFARHQRNQQTEGFNYGEDGFPSAGRVAWDAWGGDAGRTWAESIMRREEKQSCPIPTRYPDVNAANQEVARVKAMYGPMDLDDPGDYWEDLADEWDLPIEVAVQRKCGNCAAFDQSPAMLECIGGDVEGVGYCKIWDFLCSEERSCVSWSDPESTKSVSKSSAFVKQADEQRFTLGPLYVPDFMDAHGEWTDADELQTAVWGWVRSGDRRIFLQHDRDVVAGEWVEVMTMPQSWTVQMQNASGATVGEVTYPPNTVFLGVIWNENVWADVKAGKIRGYSIGGYSDRMYAELPDNGQREGIELDAES